MGSFNKHAALNMNSSTQLNDNLNQSYESNNWTNRHHDHCGHDSHDVGERKVPKITDIVNLCKEYNGEDTSIDPHNIRGNVPVMDPNSYITLNKKLNIELVHNKLKQMKTLETASKIDEFGHNLPQIL